MKHVLIAAHPREHSFTLSMARAYAEGVAAAGGEALLRDLYRIGFDPVLREEELPDHAGFAPAADVAEERRLIGDADVFALFYPLWFNAAPAILKGYIERVFGMGFAYSAGGAEGNQPLLAGRRLISFSSSGAPQHWVEESGAWEAMRTHFDEHFALMAGFTLVGHKNFGGIHPAVRADAVAQCAAEVKAEAGRLNA